MELRDYIEAGAKKAGSLTTLGKILDISQPNMSHAKAQKKGIPLDAAVKLADFIGEDVRRVIAANELVTEKKEEKRAFWRPFVEHARAAAIVGVMACAINLFAPYPAEAAPILENASGMICIMLSLKYIVKSKQRQLVESAKEAVITMFKGRVRKMEAV